MTRIKRKPVINWTQKHIKDQCEGEVTDGFDGYRAKMLDHELCSITAYPCDEG
jgi:hypothetical protein